ncbi:AMP-binding protein [Roseomonas sp. NAR14]|uniref:AMP-binding protein n=1 Tax=Roseomonas acroporae TaxID=2937791 RepID=A0A9X1Y5W5_9PROT|nr:AMP-binding protein [Roseomonas acroporae]MCK8784819.1 AMP-binding protein [Roseomonas acroporae]
MPAELPLLGRAADAVLVRRTAGLPAGQAEAITGHRFLAEVALLSARLPADGAPASVADDAPAAGGAARHAINLCADRYHAILGFAAALARGHVTLLSSDRSPRRLRELAAAYPGAYALCDEPIDDAPLPVVPVSSAPQPGGMPAGATAPNPAIPAGRVAAIAFTSGSTGVPVAHRKPWGSLVTGAGAAAARFGLDDPADPATVVATVPPQHMYGFETSVMLPLQAPCAVHAGAAFYPDDVARALRAMPGRRVLVTTPLQLRSLLVAAEGATDRAAGERGGSGQGEEGQDEGSRGTGGLSLPPLGALISATAPLAASLAEAAEAALGAPVLEIYGATEVGSIASRRTLAGPDWLPYRGTTLRLDGAGEAWAAVPGLPETALADEIALTDSGGFRLLGRRADMVKLAGRRTSLGHLNRLLNAIPGVQDGAFMAPDDLERNPAARLAAFAVAPGLTAADILTALREQVEPVFLPRPLLLLPRLPRDAVGKLQRGTLDSLRRGALSGVPAFP